MLLARMNTGRGGSGSPQAKAEQQKIMRLLGRAPVQAGELVASSFCDRRLQATGYKQGCLFCRIV